MNQSLMRQVTRVIDSKSTFGVVYEKVATVVRRGEVMMWAGGNM